LAVAGDENEIAENLALLSLRTRGTRLRDFGIQGLEYSLELLVSKWHLGEC
jgi:hypothetical protein